MKARMKKMLAVFLAVCMLAGTQGFSALASEPTVETQQSPAAEESVQTEQSSAESEESPEALPEETEKTVESGEEVLEETKGAEEESSIESDPAKETPEETASGETESSEPDSGEGISGEENSEEEISGEETSEEETESTEETEEEETESTEASLLKVQSLAAEGEVSRVVWVSELTTVFDMVVEEDNYPDNYYSDIDSSSENYYAVMLATEFGLIDVEAGEAFRPDDPATREFAAHTLNLCLGYVLEDATYTFDEADEVNWPKDIQTAINKGWFELEGSAFLPEKPITLSEKDGMIAAAEAALAEERIEQNYDGNFRFKDDVIVLPADISAQLTDEDEITIENCPVSLSVGDKFAIITNGLPVVSRAVSVSVTGNAAVIKKESVSMEEAFEALDVQGSLNGELAQAQAYDDNVEVKYIVGGTAEKEWEDGTKYDSLEEVGVQNISAIEAVRTYNIPSEVQKEFELADGMKAKITCKVSNVDADYKVSLWNRTAFINGQGDVTFSCNVSLDVLDAIGVSPSVSIVRVPVAIIGYFDVSVDMTLKGAVTLSLVEHISAGVYYDHAAGFRMTTNFYKKSFTLQAHAEASIGLSAVFDMDVVFMKGSIYGKVGVKTTVDSQTYDDGKTPLRCTHVFSWAYAYAGCNISVDLVVYRNKWGKEITLWTSSNSPLRTAFHYEDGVPVARCTREEETGADRWKYYTPADSQYGYNGASGGIGANGEPYTIFEYSLDSDNNATITKYSGNVSALSIPEILDGHTVVGIGNSVFKGNTALRVVVIPDSVTKIGSSAFENCSNLENLILSKGLTDLGYSVFGNCDALTAVEIPKSLQKASLSSFYGVFEDCDSLKNVSFEEGTTKVTNNLFTKCPGLEKIDIPDTITVIEEYAFLECTNLVEVTMPNSVTEIESSAFEKCTALKEIKLPDSVRRIGSSAFANCSNLENLILSKGLTDLGYSVFKNCDALTAVEIPKSLQNVSISSFYGVFENCDNLKCVSFEPGTTKITNNLFTKCPGLEKIDIPDTITVIEEYAFLECTNLVEVTMPNSVTEIEGNAFGKCTALKEIKLPDSVRRIGSSAFANCSNLENLILSKGLTDLGYSVFKNCDALMAVEIPKSLQKVSISSFYGVFEDCDNLKSISFEPGITKITNNLFTKCAGLEKIDIPNTVTVIEEYAFLECRNLIEVMIPDSVTEIKTQAFRACTSLQKIELPDSVIILGNSLFSECNSLREAILPAFISEIPFEGFRGCGSLTSVSIPGKVLTIRQNAFRDSGLTEIVIPESVRKIENGVFQDCKSLARVELAEGLASIGNESFRNCDALAAITIPDSVTSLGTYIFESCDALGEVNLGSGLTRIPTYAFNLCPSLKKIVLPYRMTTVDAYAFTNCTGLTEMTIPRATTSIAGSVVSYPTKMTIYGIAGTYAETWANQIGAKFVNQESKATAVELSETELRINNGNTAALTIKVTPSDFTDSVVWRSSDTSVVTVSDAGLLTAKKVGTAMVRVTVGNVSASCKVTVCQPVTRISLNRSSLSMEAFDTFALTASIYPTTADNQEIVWSSSNEAVASVDETGMVTALLKGAAVIRAAAQDGSGVYGSCTVTVTNNGYICTSAEDMESEHNYPVNCTDAWSYKSEGAEKLFVTFDERTEVEEAFDFLYLYDGEGNLVGKYTGTELAGKTVEIPGDTVKVKLSSDEAGTAWGFKVTKIEAVGGPDQIAATKITLDKTAVTLNPGEACQLTAVLEPADSTDRISFSSSDTGVARVSEGGEITALEVGAAEITAKATSGVTAVCKVTVEERILPKLKAPEASLISGSKVSAGTEIELNCAEDGATIYYTVDRTAPTKASAVYTAPIKVEKDTMIRAFVAMEGYQDSQTATFIYYVTEASDDASSVLPEDIPEDGIPDGLWIAGLADQIYTGSAIRPEVRVYDGSIRLAAGKDYSIAYKNNTKVNDASNEKTAPTVTVTGKGNYSGKETATFKILQKDISEEDIYIADLTVKYNKKVQKAVPTVLRSGKKLTNKKDFRVEYPDAQEGAYQQAGTYTVRIVGIGGYCGEKEVRLTITEGVLMSKVTVSKISSQPYTGEAVEPAVTVKNGKVILEKDVDYSISYENNIEIGKAKLILTGLGEYAGTREVTFTITGDALGKAKVNGWAASMMYTGEEITQNCKLSFTVSGKTVELTEGEDYNVSYQNNVKAGKATVIFTGINGYSGTLKKTFTISPYLIEKDEGQAFEVEEITDAIYAKGGSKPQPIVIFKDRILQAGTDYTLSYKNNTAVNDGSNPKKVPTVTVTGKGNFKGKRTVTYQIEKQDISILTAAAPDRVFAKKKGAWKSAPSVTDLDGKKLAAGKDYEKAIVYTYGEDTVLNDGTSRKAGAAVEAIDIPTAGCTIRVTLNGIGNYKGTVSAEYRIVQTDIKNAKVTIPAQIYTGSAIEPGKADMKVAIGKTILEDSDYEIVSCTNNVKKGSASVTIKGIGNYGGTKTVKFTIKAKGFSWWWK